MSTTAQPAAIGQIRFLQRGRTFMHPALDYLLIGGLLSLALVFVFPLEVGMGAGAGSALLLPYCVLFFNSAHFAASTVRLYAKPGALAEWPFLTMVLPLVAIAVVSVAVAFPGLLGRHLVALYLTWSPYHYAAQAFGLAVMYSYRSGCTLEAGDRRLLWWSCMLPFLYAFVSGSTSGLGWVLPPEVFAAAPKLAVLRSHLSFALVAVAVAMPLILVLRLGRAGRAFPAISLLVMIANGVWWIAFTYMDAFLWATVFHGIQYLAIVTIFHVRDQTGRPGNRRGPGFHALVFYAACLGLGYLLFEIWPFAYAAAGSRLSEAVILVVAIVNLHHFIVDRYIWRLRKDPNYRIVTGGEVASA